MSQRGKRGRSRCAKTYPATSYIVTFNELGLADSDTTQRFANWMGVEVRARVSYLKGWKKVTEKVKDQLWLTTKETWNINVSDDEEENIKAVVLKKMNAYHRKYKTNLTHMAQEGKDPLLVYEDMDMEDWPAFVASRNSPEFLEKSAKAKANALKNTDRHKMGRTSYVGLEKKLEPIMEDLERRYPEIAKLECRRSKRYIFGRLSDNDFTSLKELTNSLYDKLKELLAKEQEMKADGTYYIAGKEAFTEYFGPDHSGRTRCVSDVVGKRKALGVFKKEGKKKKKITVEDFDGLKDAIAKPLNEKIAIIEADLELLRATLNNGGSFMGMLQGTSSSGGSIDVFDGIKVPTLCELLVPYGEIEDTVAKAMLYPRLDGMLDGIQLRAGYSKVLVDTVVEDYLNNAVVVPTDNIRRLSESVCHFIQWPQKFIKLYSRMEPVEPSMPTNPRLDENALQRMVDKETSFKAKCSSQISHNSYQTDRLKLLKKMPLEIQVRASLFMNRENPNEAINVDSFDGMYHEKYREQVDTNSLIGWMTNDWIDVAIIHWLCMHLYETRNQNSRIAFLNPAHLQSSICLEDRELAVTLTRKTLLIHTDKSFFLLPYHQGGHWTLIVIHPSNKKGYIFDSYNKDMKKRKTPDDFLVVNLLNEACQVTLDWTLPKCNQQKETWECGYYVMKWILDFFMIIQHKFPENFSKYFTTTKPISKAELNKLVDCTSKAFYDYCCQPCKQKI